MRENNVTQMTSISKATSLEEFADFWDTHSLAEPDGHSALLAA